MIRSIHTIVFLLSLMLPGPYNGQAQDIHATGRFLHDSTKIGARIPFYLIARYPQDRTLLFPDSTFDFIPFEFESKYIVPTSTTNGYSYDSVIYYLSTFDLSPMQYIRLPVYLVVMGDSSIAGTVIDSIYLKELVTQPIPDSVEVTQLPLKTDTRYLPVHWIFNYPVWAGIGAGIVLLIVLVWILLGKRIRKYYRIRRLRRNHERFIANFEGQLGKLKTRFHLRETESTLITWKRYMEQLEAKPFTKLTSRELILVEPDPNLGNSLRSIDRAIYGHEAPVDEPFRQLKDYAERKFRNKLEEVEHG